MVVVLFRGDGVHVCGRDLLSQLLLQGPSTSAYKREHGQLQPLLLLLLLLPPLLHFRVMNSHTLTLNVFTFAHATNVIHPFVFLQVGLIQFCLSAPKTDMENNVVVSDYAAMDRILREERKYILGLCKKVSGRAPQRSTLDNLCT